MGNSASLNATINARLSQLESMDINLSKSISKYSTNKCAACQTTFNIISFKKRKCVNCLENYCTDCVKHYKDNIFICYRCQIFMSPDFGWSELMKLKSKDLIWYLNRRNIPCSDCKEKEQLVELVLEKFRIPSNINRFVNVEHCNEAENIANTDQGLNNTFNTNIVNDCSNNLTNSENVSNCSIPSSSKKNSNIRKFPPPTYEEAMDGGYSSSQVTRNERVPIEDITNIAEIELLSIKQLKDMLAYNKVDYKGCVERHELVSRVERLWIAYNSDLNSFQNENTDKLSSVKECAICMDRPVDCVLIECGHMLCCVRCGSKLAECPICRQNVVRCIRVFPAQ